MLCVIAELVRFREILGSQKLLGKKCRVNPHLHQHRTKELRMHSFYEFFAGGGMARAGLGDSWNCTFANDFDYKKGATYETNWGSEALKIGDVRSITIDLLPDHADLAWGSFPCQDLSLAGGGAGLKGERSGTFFPFWKIMEGLMRDGRAPRLIVLENVLGTLTSHDGADFKAICRAFSESKYRYGALIINAALFLPQSRPRLFVIGVHESIEIPSSLISEEPSDVFHPRSLLQAVSNLPDEAFQSYVWWKMPKPPQHKMTFADIIEKVPTGVEWHTETETERLLNMMSPTNLEKVRKAVISKKRIVGGIYRRTRRDENGIKVQRAEVRFDVAGCLRTPAGGSSRQIVIVVDKGRVRTRLISARETARLMGLSDTYKLPKNYNEAYHLTGDGVAVPVVRYLAQEILEPLLVNAWCRN